MNEPTQPDPQSPPPPPAPAPALSASEQSNALAAAVAAATAAASAANAAASAAASAATAANTIIAVVSGGTPPPPVQIGEAGGASPSAAPPLSAPAGYHGENTNGAGSRANIHNYNPAAASPPYQQNPPPADGRGGYVTPSPYQNTDSMNALPPPFGYPGEEAEPNAAYGATGQWKAHHIKRGRFHDAPWDDDVANLVASGPVPLRMEWTPPPFFHLYASLEQSFARLSGYNKGSLFVGVTSAILGEGKTTVALHLALSAARATQKRVCLIDLSLGEDDLCRRVGAAPAPGGAVSLIEENGVLGVMELSEPSNLTFIPAGKLPANPAQMARSKMMSEFFTTLRGEYDLVIVDMPAVVTDNAVPLAALMDGVVLVMQAGATPRAMASEAIEKLGRDRVAGVVLNRIASSSLGQTLPTTRRGEQTGNEAAVGSGRRSGRN